METKCFLGCSMCLEGFWAVLSALLFSIKLQLKGELQHEHFVSFLMAENSIPVAHGKAGEGPNKHQLVSGLGTVLVHSQAMPFLCDSPGCCWQTEKGFWRPFSYFQNHPYAFFQEQHHQTLCCSSGPSAHSHSQGKLEFFSILTILKVCECHYQSLEWGHGKQKNTWIKGRILHPPQQWNGNGKAS